MYLGISYYLMREERQMLQHTMLELKDKAKGFAMVRQNHTVRPYRIKNTKAEIHSSAEQNPREMSIIDNVEEDGPGTTNFQSEETVFAAPKQNMKFKNSHRLVVLSGDSTDKTYLLDHPKMMIGRDQSSHIRIYENTVSLFHAMIYIKENECFLKDLSSKNGTIVNGSCIKDELKLKDGDKIEIGPTILSFIRGDLGHFYELQQLSLKKRYITGIYQIAGKIFTSGSNLFASTIRELGRSFENLGLFREKRIATSVIAIASIIILAVFISLYQIQGDDSQPGTLIEQKNPVAYKSSGEKNISNSTGAGNTQQELSPAKEKSLSLDEKGLQLTEKAIHHYVNGNIALSFDMLEETLQLNLPDNSVIKNKALSIKDAVVDIYMLYKEGLNHYNKSNMGQAIMLWSKALKSDQGIVGQTSSHFANQIANHTGDIFYKLAQEALNKGNNEKAQEFCSQTFRALPSHKGCIAIMNTL